MNKEFTHLYPLSKTLRFELKPMGKTTEYMQINSILEHDKQRAEDFKKVKKIADRYHKRFIEQVLNETQLPQDALQEYAQCYFSSQRDKDIMQSLRKKLREYISNQFKKTNKDEYKRLFGKELINEELFKVAQSEEEKTLITTFKGFTTYFSGFNKNRENMYSEEEKSTAISYRLINDNLPIFLDNIKIFRKLKESPLANDLAEIYNLLKEHLRAENIDQMFEIDFYNNVLTQKQIEAYNLVIAGRTEKDQNKIQGLNERINLHNQQIKSKNDRLPKLKQLKKQILSDRTSLSWLPEEFKTDTDVLESINKAYKIINEQVINKREKGEYSLKELLEHLKDYDLSGIYIKNDESLSTISQRYLGNYDAIKQAILEQWTKDNPKSEKKKEEKYLEEQDKYWKKSESFSIEYIDKCLNKEAEIENYFICQNKKDKGEEDYFQAIERLYNDVKPLLESYPKDKKLAQDDEAIKKIKTFLDSIQELKWFLKPLLGNKDEADKDEIFFSQFSELWDTLNENITQLYNKTRNYITKKPYSIDKIKVNFENSYLLSGWGTDYTSKAGLIVQKAGNYYLVIVDKNLSKEDKARLREKAQDSLAIRYIYDFQKPDNKNIPRLFIRSKGDNYAPAVSEYNLPIEKIIDIYDSGKFKTEYRKKNPQEYAKALVAMIDYFKMGLQRHCSYKNYDFKWKNSKDYKDIAEFYKDVQSSCYRLLKEEINFDTLLDLVAEHKVYLFQIYNKDFSSYSKGTPNMHTLYWRMLFDEANLSNVVYTLNGGAELFFREHSLKRNITHLAKEPIAKKNKANEGQTSNFDYDLIKDKRFTQDKCFLYVPITLNFKSSDTLNINSKVNNYIKDGNIKYIIGIDRGERNLIYLTIIDTQGNIIEQRSLNIVENTYKDNSYTTNYHQLLDEKEEDKKKARTNWKTINNIKELKEGYMSQVIHQITQMMIEKKAIVVMEDLNRGFKRGRQKVEKQVYQKFEKMLIDKLNYLADKHKTPQEEGGILNAYQLTNKFTSFAEIGKQNGFLFYIPAWNTSKIDPVTGFVSYFRFSECKTNQNIKDFFGLFDDIRYNSKADYFEFILSEYTKFNPKASDTRQNWIICTNKDRIKTSRNSSQNNQWVSETVCLTKDFKALFNLYHIDYSCDLKTKILSQKEKEGEFLHKLLSLLKLTVQMRNSNSQTDEDYIISPVADSRGIFFDSRDYEKQGSKAPLPIDADANGAYNIARKGLWAMDQIKHAKDTKNISLAISNVQWLQYVQKKNMK